MFNEVNFLGLLIVIAFVLYCWKMIQKGPYIYLSSNKHHVDIYRNNFSVSKLKIKKGDTIIWTNKDIIRHTVYVENPIYQNSEILNQDESFRLTFDQAGTFTFASSLYKKFTPMLVKVEEPIKGDDYLKNINSLLVSLFKFLDIFQIL